MGEALRQILLCGQNVLHLKTLGSSARPRPGHEEGTAEQGRHPRVTHCGEGNSAGRARHSLGRLGKSTGREERTGACKTGPRVTHHCQDRHLQAPDYLDFAGQTEEGAVGLGIRHRMDKGRLRQHESSYTDPGEGPHPGRVPKQRRSENTQTSICEYEKAKPEPLDYSRNGPKRQRQRDREGEREGEMTNAE